ncbi:tRNA (adenosine(37)-N6)-threonylcarbamoyltransferase complex transferase subunit TsaD [Desulfallas sp. Bu1-1]|uniref:tRNA (adenosine(37)-N6)-threonylcarbamoyltransferase complex transferase subunit TsaD n=1 Tax=Desulfallas sp. Bu1-1 TaxID=2787620 RepID=UPI00189E276A|nr:tRNA (adenosine(37)-N6)-threonylcarbamoyltransferase complex transferase subunit TsaD [Desulfallas sp. Bu1-1]MBF7083145.1 tRNA (adenosine(37)-N6)-threonylcarbamoyltransferase complex transferase subunit TsaD [Desulfallas sp. Bu1-1]
MSIVILGIETSCDETSAAVVVDGVTIKSNVISSQVDIHRKFGGVVPEIASRKHLEMINAVIREALDRAEIDFKDLDAVAVTYGPGLVGALLVGVAAAKAIAYGLDLPLLGVNHIEGHIFANMLVESEPGLPVLCLIVSGGHTDLVLIREFGRYELLGSTRDDAAGEAFDKVARVLGLGYPGGPLIDKLAACGNKDAIPLPRAYLEEGSFDFSFSGLKTAVINYIHRAVQKGGEHINKADVAASFRQAIVDVLADKTMLAARRYATKNIMLAGGVAANTLLREQLSRRASEEGLRLIYPPPVLCTDNAAMIACAAYYKYLRQDFAPLTLNAVPNLRLGRDCY